MRGRDWPGGIAPSRPPRFNAVQTWNVRGRRPAPARGSGTAGGAPAPTSGKRLVVRQKSCGWPVSRVLSRRARRPGGDGHSSGTTVAHGLVRSTRTTGRRRPWTEALSSLSDLAPGGACRAAPVAGGAVGSYPTISPLPGIRIGEPRRSVFCGAFPEVRGCPLPRRALPGTVPPWSPDFPHAPPESDGARPSGHPRLAPRLWRAPGQARGDAGQRAASRSSNAVPASDGGNPALTGRKRIAKARQTARVGAHQAPLSGTQ